MVLKLRAYQREIARELTHLLGDQHHLDVGLEAPMGSGKTTVCKAVVMALHGSGVVRLVVVLAPLDNIVEAWAKSQARAAGLLDGRAIPAWNAARRATAAQLADPRWWATATGAWVATRQAACSAKAIAALKASGADLRGVLVVADEAHHHNDRTRAGEHAAAVRSLGGAVLLVSGTPWHARGSVFTEATEVVRLSAAELARHRDAHGRPYAPTEWRVERRHVGEASDARAAVEPAGGKDPEARGPKAADVCAQIAADWLADGRPCAVINLPWTSWRAPMLRALRTTGARVLNMIGEEGKNSSALLREAACKVYDERKVDIVLSCARMNEGTDWPLCAAVYNVRIPGSAQLILQRWARAARGKWEIEGYPAQWRDVQLLRFYVPRLMGAASSDAWDQHRDLALMLACYLEDYQRAQAWAAVLGPPRARFEGRRGDRTAPTRRPAPGAAPEIDPVEAARIRAHALQAAGRPAATMAAVIADLRKRHPGIAPAQIKALALGAVQAEGIDLRAKARTAEAGVLKPGKASTVVRAELAERWAAIADEFAHVMVSPRSDLIEQAAKFSAEDAEAVAERLCTDDIPDTRGYAWSCEHISAEAERFRAQYGRWPTQRDGSWPGFAERSWAMADNWLRKRGLSLHSFLRESSVRRISRSCVKVSLSISKVKAAIEMHLAATGRLPTSAEGRCDALDCSWSTICGWLRGEGTSVRALAGVVGPTSLKEKATAVAKWKAEHGHWPIQSSQEGQYLLYLRKVAGRGSSEACALLDEIGAPRRADRSASMKRRIGASPLVASLVVRDIAGLWKEHVGTRLGKRALTRPSKRWPWSACGVPLERFDYYLSRGVRGCGKGEWSQATSLRAVCDEIDADCWRLWLDSPDGPPDPRPWAEILAAGYNSRVARAERVAYLDWADPSPNGKPARRPWEPAEWPDLRAAVPELACERVFAR